jgi:hypothetical protein
MSATAIDREMERASRALEATRYFEAERIARRALEAAYSRRDYERMARVLLPLQEARRQKRQLAADVGPARVLGALPGSRKAPHAGLYLLQPPLIAADARALRERADAAKVPVYVLVREPLTRDGLWPIVASSPGVAGGPPVTIRTKVSPPAPVPRVERSPTRDAIKPGSELPAAWFEAAGEALGDAAIAKIDATHHPAWRVDDLMALLDAHPDHEKLHQRLGEACREAVAAPPPERRRPRPLIDDPFVF